MKGLLKASCVACCLMVPTYLLAADPAISSVASQPGAASIPATSSLTRGVLLQKLKDQNKRIEALKINEMQGYAVIPVNSSSSRDVLVQQLQQKKKQIKTLMEKITPDKHSVLDVRLKSEGKVDETPFSVSLFEPNYVLPFYYTFSPSPYYADHPDSSPDDQKVQSSELKAQLSLLLPIWQKIFKSPITLYASYTQDMFWQVYSKSPYFRETNYEPQLFFSYPLMHNWLLSAGINHQSNGRGGTFPGGMERSWNRAFICLEFSGSHWLVHLKPWLPIFKHWSSDLHNPDIARYLGYGETVLAYKYKGFKASLMMRNLAESDFKRGALELDLSYPISHKISAFVLLFTGYGQSLIEYNHYTNSVGIGVSMNNWI